MNFNLCAICAVLIAALAGCSARYAETGQPDGVAHAIEHVVATISTGHEISTSFEKEKAAAAPAEMYPSF